VNELSQIHSLSDLPVPSTLLNLAKKGYAPVQRKKKFKEQMTEMKSQSTQSLAQSIQSTLHATLPRSLSEKQLLVRSRVEHADILAERRALVESKCVSELSQLSSFHDIPVPSTLSRFFRKSMEKLDSLAHSFKSFSTTDLAATAAISEDGMVRLASRRSLHSDLYASLPRTLKEQVLVRTKVEEDEAVLRERQTLVQSRSPAELSQIHGLHDLPLPTRLEHLIHHLNSLKEQRSGAASVEAGGSHGNIFNKTGTCPRPCIGLCLPPCPSPAWFVPRWRTLICCWKDNSCSRPRASMSFPRLEISMRSLYRETLSVCPITRCPNSKTFCIALPGLRSVFPKNQRQPGAMRAVPPPLRASWGRAGKAPAMTQPANSTQKLANLRTIVEPWQKKEHQLLTIASLIMTLIMKSS